MKHFKWVTYLACTIVFSLVLTGQFFGQKAEAEEAIEASFTQELLRYTASNGESLDYFLTKPDNYSPSKRYPLVTYLHGIGGDVDQSAYEALKDEILKRNLECIIVAPLASYSQGQFWIDYSSVLALSPPYMPYSQSMVPITPALFAAKELIDSTKEEYRTDSYRNYIIGVSMGAYGTWDIITRYPDMFTAAVPICGAGDPETASAICNMSIWAFHGSRDTAVSVIGSRNMYEALLNAGSTKVHYTEYEGLDHGIWFKVFADQNMLSWLFDQGTGMYDTFRDFSKISNYGGVSLLRDQAFGDQSFNCIIRNEGDEGYIEYIAKEDNYFESLRAEAVVLYDDLKYYMDYHGYSSINDFVCLDVKTRNSDTFSTVLLNVSEPIVIGKDSTGVYTYSSVTLSLTAPLPEETTMVKVRFSDTYITWYLMLREIRLQYANSDHGSTDPPEEKDTWDGHMTEGWNGIDDFSHTNFMVDHYLTTCIYDGNIQQSVLVRTSTEAGYIRYAQKNCYISDFSLDASLIEGFLPANVNDYFTVYTRIEGSNKDIPIALSKTEGLLLYENNNSAYNYYSSYITPTTKLPNNVISIKIEMAPAYLPYTMYLDKATLIFSHKGT